MTMYSFPAILEDLRKRLRYAPIVSRGRVHAQDVSDKPSFDTYELANVVVRYAAPSTIQAAQGDISPNLPWAEDHFQERVGGRPLNPAPSEAWWPFRQNGNAAHKDGEVFSHTYPERMWPKMAAGGVEWESSYGREPNKEHKGIRYEYGDLDDVADLLRKDPFTRQAYLPIWFPEDTGAVDGQRVPCSLGYHFIRRGHSLDCQYFMRSCDFFRHFPDDVYMAVRLMQWMVERITEWTKGDSYGVPYVGDLTIFISNLHAFRGDTARLQA